MRTYLFIPTLLLFFMPYTTLYADDKSDLNSFKDVVNELEDKVKEYDVRGNALVGKIKDLLKSDEEAMEDLIEEMCGYDIESLGDNAHKKAEEMTKSIARKAENRYKEIANNSDELRKKTSYVEDRAEGLIDDIGDLTDSEQVGNEAKNLQKRAGDIFVLAKKIVENGDKRHKQLDRAAKGVLLGANNPIIRARQIYGIEMHKEMQNDFDCDKKESEVGGADCVVFEKCTVYEFKPSGYSESDALSQLNRYLPNIRKKFKDNSIVKEKCPIESDGLPKFDVVMATYRRCTP